MIYFVGAGPGAVDLITIKGLNLLKEAKCVIYAGSLVNKKLLDYAQKDCIIYNSANMTLDEVIAVMEENERKGIDTVRLHTGDPSLFGAVREQYDRLDTLNIKYEVVPGVSSFLGAAASLKKEYTLPDVSQSLIITRMEGRTKVPFKESISSFSEHNCSMAIFLSVAMIDELSRELMKGYDKTTPVAVVYKATWEDEKIITSTLENIAQEVKKENINKTALVIVGEFLGDKYELSRLYDESFTHEYRKAVKGKIYVVGISSGNPDSMTKKALFTLENCDVIVGYTTYVNQIRKIFPHKEYITTPMGKEKERCKLCIDLCKSGKTVSLISSGDAGIYGMSGPLEEMNEDCETEVISGVTSAIMGANRLGAPLMNDFCVISLSDIMTDRDLILKRVKYASLSDMVICFYNPKSTKRQDLIKECIEIIRENNPNSVVGLVKNAEKENEEKFIYPVSGIDYDKIDMDTVVIVGNSYTIVKNNKMITKRGYTNGSN